MQQEQDEGQRDFLSSPAQPSLAFASIIVSSLPSFPQKWHFLEEEEKEDERKSEGREREREREEREESNNFFLLLHPSTMSPFGRSSVSPAVRGPIQVFLPPVRTYPIHAETRQRMNPDLCNAQH